MTNLNETLLEYVNEIGDNEKFWNDKFGKNKDKNKKLIGSNNIRQLAILALEADCYEEFRLFIKYKTAKGNGWEAHFNDKGERFGDVIINYIDKIYEASNRDDKEALKSISRFFGYLYWKKRIIGDKE